MSTNSPAGKLGNSELSVLELQNFAQKCAQDSESDRPRLTDTSRDALLRLTDEALVIRTPEDKITFWNASAERLFGWSAREAVGQSLTALTGADPAIFREAVRHVSENETWDGELEILDKSGHSKLIFCRCRLHHDANGAPSILCAATDITERRELERVLLRAQRMDSIGSLASGIAHDLNNALAPVLMTVQLLKNSPDDATRDNYLELTAAGIERATGLVSQILKFARGIAEEQHGVSLDFLLRDLLKMMRETFPKSIDIRLLRPETPLWTACIDATELHQALLNLCVNSRDAMPNGGELVLTVENVLFAAPEAAPHKILPGHFLRITVADTGSGIAPEVLPRVFEPFFTTKTGHQGTGLGLSTVESILRRCGGAIDLQTHSGKGTSVTLLIPAVQNSIQPVSSLPAAAPPRGNHDLILFIDDEPAVTNLARATLEDHGFRVVTAANGAEGLSQFKIYQPLIRVVVSDADMPVANGFAVVNSVTQTSPETPVILVSGSQHDTQFLRKRFQNIPHRLPKPYTPNELLWAVHAAMRATAPISATSLLQPPAKSLP